MLARLHEEMSRWTYSEHGLLAVIRPDSGFFRYFSDPKGKVNAPPARSTPVDFAYAIHTEVGHRCIGARVNSRLVPLETRLNSADTVEIFTSKSPTAGPSRDWLQIVASTRARNKIRQWFSRERREDAIENGREELARALRRDGLPLHKLLGSSSMLEVAESMNRPAQVAILSLYSCPPGQYRTGVGLSGYCLRASR